jgi:hypothetical protein
MTVGRKIIHDSQTIRVILQPGETDDFFVTFNELGLKINADSFWGDKLFADTKFSSVGFVTATPNWYPPDEMEPAISAVKSIIGRRRIIAYGHSQGGYGALKYSRALGAQVVVAFCPQWSIDPSDVAGVDGRFHSYHRVDLQNGLQINSDDLAGDRYLIFDKEARFDKWNVEKILGLGGSKVIRCPFTGHQSVRILSEGGVSREFVNIFRQPQDDYTQSLRKLIREARVKSATYKRNLLNYLATRGSVTLFEKYALGTPEHIVGGVRINLAIKQNDVELLKNIVPATSSVILGNSDLMALWKIFHNRNMIKEELYVANVLAEKFKNDPWKRLHTVNSLIRANLKHEAEIQLREIINQFGTKIGSDHIKRFAKILGLEDISGKI